MDLPMVLALAVAILFFLVSGAIAVRNVQALREGNAQIRYTHDVIRSLDQLFSTVQDAETGQRGFLLTGDPAYLEPYDHAVSEIPVHIGRIEALVQDHDVQRARLPALRTHVTAKLGELQETIALRRQGDGKAKAVIDSGRGKAEMDAIRAQLDEMREEELRIRALRVEEMEAAVRNAVVSSLLSGALGVALVLVMAALLRRTGLARARQAWLQRGQVELAEALQGDMAAPELGRAMLSFLTGYTGAQAGALFADEGGRFRRLAMLGVPADAAIADGFGPGEGMLGQVAANGRAMVVSDIPDGYLTIGSALGRDNPRHLLLAPLRVDDNINGVIELGFLQPVGADLPGLFEQSASLLGTALRSAKYRSELQDLLEETQRQSEELQVQSEELRVSNEGLEEQSRALRESQVRLEGQQAELEQINTQLEDQARELARQRDNLARSNAEVELKARELERSSQYKSDFLANMSHELRTPLNSLLILSKLLGDNPDGNLTGEQVGFARTIESSGSDLLLLINDILDLSKIEAGHLRIHPQIVPLQRLVADLRQQFQHVAAEKGLGFSIELDAVAPTSIESDSQRLQQILKNLLSNALKFTEAGEVSLRILAAGEDGVAFAVRDTGIGISPDQQAHVFEAFHQADGAISRRYGGTGLGLSISRELARLLGGGITLDSTPGEGSLFTVTLPLRYDPSSVAAPDAHPRPEPEPAPQAPLPEAASNPPAAAPRAPVEDDRHRLTGNRRILLVVEDDPAFARIMCDLSREMGFECLVAGTAEEALAVVREFRPSAVVLDIGLPDQSGLTVLDRLKQDDATRHIPVHVISGGDHAHAALSLGAMGYLLKPVRRDQMADVLRGLEQKLAQTMRRVLIVEDDPVQREAVQRLLEAGGAQTVGAGSAAECMERLDEETFDCMVLDLSLPDASGFSLLERLGESDRVEPFPPVIVYTGHDLSPQEEQRLRRYSSSIIIKGAKSPERLLDEVSLFLHQVVSDLPPEQQRMIRAARHRDAMLEGRRILIVEDDVRNVYSLSNVLEPRGARIEIARNGREAIAALAASAEAPENRIDLVLMDVMMPVMDGLTATKEIRRDPRWRNLPIIALTANAMPDDQERCLRAGASDYMSKPLDVEKLLSLVRVWLAG